MLHQLSIPILHIYAAAKHNSDSVPKFEQVDLSGYDGLGSVLPSVESITGEEDGEVRGAASGYVSDEDESVEDIIDLRTEDDYLSDEDYYYDEELYGDDEDLSTVFNPNDLSGYGGDQEHAVPEDHGEDDDDYYYDGEYYEDNYDIDQQPEMIDLRGTQPLVIDNYSGKRRKR